MDHLEPRRSSRRSTRIRTAWQRHIKAQQASGLRQSIWCREHGISPKYFSLWKSKLAKARTVVAAGLIPKSVSSRLAMVPVVVKSAAVAETVGRVTAATGVELSVNVTLPNGIALAVELFSVRLLSPLLSELARLSC